MAAAMVDGEGSNGGRRQQPAPRRRRVRRRIVVVGAIALALLGVGLNWTGRGPGVEEVAGGPPPSAREEGREVPAEQRAGTIPIAEPGPPPAPPGGAEEALPAAAPGAATSAAAPLVEPAEGAGEPTPGADPAASSAPALDPDRFASLTAAARQGIASQRFGEAQLTLELVQALPLDGAQRRVIDRLELEFAAGVAALCEQLVSGLRAGEVLAARVLLDRAREGGAECRQALQEALAAAGLVGRLDATPREVRERWPLPAPLPRDRLVRVSLPGRSFAGRVVDCRTDRATLRVEDSRGVTYPTVPLLACEPDEVTAGEAAELGFAAVHAGDLLLARLWLACALTRKGETEPRVRRLAALLR